MESLVRTYSSNSYSAVNIINGWTKEIKKMVAIHQKNIEEARLLLECVKKLEHELREKYKLACRELDLLQNEYPIEIWYPIDISFGERQILDKLEELSLKRFKASDMLDMKIQNFEGSLVLLREIDTELNTLKETIEVSFGVRSKLRSGQGTIS